MNGCFKIPMVHPINLFPVRYNFRITLNVMGKCYRIIKVKNALNRTFVNRKRTEVMAFTFKTKAKSSIIRIESHNLGAETSSNEGNRSSSKLNSHLHIVSKQKTTAKCNSL